jgi:predicted acyl esterase
MATTRALLLAALSLSTVLAGCFNGGDGKDDDATGNGPAGSAAHTTAYTAFERVGLPFNVSGAWSQTLLQGPYGILPGTGHFVSVDLPVSEGGAAIFDPINGPRVHLGLFLPDVPAGTKVPVVADVGPYYRESSGARRPVQSQAEGATGEDLPAYSPEMDPVATEPANRLGRFLIENLVPHGFAVAQVSVFGSGDSNHCFDMFGTAEQLGVDAAVTWLGSQDWSNGNVALIGRSYDGSTPWMAAAFGNPHLKSIVPISGLTGLQDLVTRNGTSEQRVATFQNVVYGGYGFDGDAGDVHTLCTDWLTAAGFGAGALATGDTVVPVEGTYWEERQFFPRVLENYGGSVYFIHGLQDWNVDPHIISPAFQQLRDKGLDVKGLFGQWGHMYPDRPGEHASLPQARGGDAFPFTVRYDWAEDLLEWFTFYLKDEGPRPVLKVEVQDQLGRWRVEDTFPPQDASETPMAIPGAPVPVGPGSPRATFDLGALHESAPMVLSGHMYLMATVTPSGADGQIFFDVVDLDNESRRLAFGTLGLRHHGPEAALPLVPQQQVLVRVQSEPFDFTVPAGHRLQLRVSQTGEGLQALPTAAPMTFDPAASELLMPVIQRDPSVYFAPPAWNGTANASPPQP